MAEQDVCPHLDSIGEVTKEDLLQKSKVGFLSHPVTVMPKLCVSVRDVLSSCVCHGDSPASTGTQCNNMDCSMYWRLCFFLTMAADNP